MHKLSKDVLQKLLSSTDAGTSDSGQVSTYNPVLAK
jgi:hypothetical protein